VNLESKLYTQYLPMKPLNILLQTPPIARFLAQHLGPRHFGFRTHTLIFRLMNTPVIHNAVHLPIPLARNRDAKNALPSYIFSVHILCFTILAPSCHASPPRCVLSKISSCRRPPLNIKPRSRPSQRPHFLPC